jgi:YHS domain-containing protein
MLSYKEGYAMRRAALWLTVFLTLGALCAQEAMQCPSCTARAEIAKILTSTKQPADWVKIHNGMLWVVQGNNEQEGKTIQKQLDELAKAMRDEKVTVCSECQMQRSVLRSLDWEITKTKRGGIMVVTSNDATMVSMLHQYADEQQRMQSQPAPATTTPAQPRPQAEPSAQTGTKEFAGKGDGINTCPVTGEPVNKESWAEIKGRKVYFCCASCRSKALKDPDKYIR